MYLLNATTDNIQAASAMVSGLLALITLWLAIRSKDQAKQIAELSGIAKQLADANEIQSEFLEIEMVATMKQRMPIFVIRKSVDFSNREIIQIEIQNVGLPHQYLHTFNHTPNIAKFLNSDTEAGSKYNPVINVHMNAGEDLDNYEFDVVSTSELGIQYVQRYKKTLGSKGRLLPPKAYPQVKERRFDH